MHAAERDTPRVKERRRHFDRMVASLNPRRLVFLDEFGVNLGMSPTYGWSPVGVRCQGAAPIDRGPNLTFVVGLRLDGPLAPMLIQGAMNADTFVTYVGHVLVPQLRSGDVVVCDNLGSHHDARVEPLIRKAGAYLLYLPPYSPDRDPVEACGSAIKAHLRKAAARTREDIECALANKLDALGPAEARGWFAHYGYIPNTS